MTIATQIELIREVKFTWRRPLSQIMNGAHKCLSEGFWEDHEGKPHRPLWALVLWKLRNWIPAWLWDADLAAERRRESRRIVQDGTILSRSFQR